MTITRRKFIKTVAIQSAAVASIAILPGAIFAKSKPTGLTTNSIAWEKTTCKFCDTGCGLLVGFSGKNAVSVKGDPNCSVHKKAGCINGYHSTKIMYGCGSVQSLSSF